MRRLALIALLLAAPGSAGAAGSGGTAAPSEPVTTGHAGGAPVGSGAAPVARLGVRVAAGRPQITVRIDEPAVPSVVARLEVVRSGRVVARVALGRVPTGRPVAVPWRGGTLPAGRYTVLLHARDRWANQLRRTRRAPGRLAFSVAAAPAPEPAPDPPPGRPEPVGPVSAAGVFPVSGPHSYGEGFGVDRGDHRHQGQDIAAARGTPVVAPLGGTVVAEDYQPAGAGVYVVLAAANGHTYFFAHCMTRSVPVSAGQTVAAGALLCRVGSTGRSTGPHVHVEDWVGGWRTGKDSRPIDPMPQLRAWGG